MADYQPSAVQQEFHDLTVDEALFGGSAGPGKTLALLMDPMQQLLVEHQRFTEGKIARSTGWAIHFRREFPMLEQTIDRSHRYFRAIDPGAAYDSQRHLWTFSCGYKLQFGHMKNDHDYQNYLSSEFTHIAFDELCQFTYDQYINVITRLRSSDPVLRTMLKVRAASNPDGGWIREYFVDPAAEGRTVLRRKIVIKNDNGEDETVYRTRLFLPALLKDNPDPEFRRTYEINLRDKPAHIRMALLEGNWYTVADAYFAEEFDQRAHVVKPFRIPAGWSRFRSCDWGYKSWCVVHWWAVDPDGNMICYRELNMRQKDAAEAAKIIGTIEKDAGPAEWDSLRNRSKLTGPMDTQAWEQRGTLGPTIAEEMFKRGISWQKCTKNKRASVMAFLHRLKDRTGEAGRPGIIFFDNCRMSIRTIPSMKADETDPEMPKDGGDDHWLDSVLYAVMSRVAVRKSDDPPKDFDVIDLEEARTAKRGRLGYGGV